MEIFIGAIILLGIYILFNYIMGYRKNQIVIDFEERYVNVHEHMEAIQAKLETQGRKVEQNGVRGLLIDNRPYFFIERTINMGGIPMQRTILVPEKKE
ncbi:hypothetical protein ACERII_00270 [Evansella sp. AB-rgal1]|uniref:hypothetical protein n=1 Tax=Evansella sp. AB-rgal1 TaxID=3242696 RepID=UPI00359E72DC